MRACRTINMKQSKDGLKEAVQVCFSRRKSVAGTWSIWINGTEVGSAERHDGESHIEVLRGVIERAKANIGHETLGQYRDDRAISFLAGMLVEAYDRGEAESHGRTA